MPEQINPEMLRRIAAACRNVQKQAPAVRVTWFDWVPKELERMARALDDELAARDAGEVRDANQA